MDNRKIGLGLLALSCIMLVLLSISGAAVYRAYQAEIEHYVDAGLACPSDPNACPHEQRSRSMIPIYLSAVVIASIAALGLYMVVFDKSQQAILQTLDRQKAQLTSDEKFGMLMRGLDEYEKKVVKAIREQDGITQQTLRYRTDMHKSKLSLVLDQLERRGIIARVPKGKTNELHLKFDI
ncbi:hypothetical protein COY28_03400 [Candidatus Woesearchaeota archaeon CG_4_10_14_0_2_um_filter_57_5]|nr:MAG: hypothetical protein AUJ68_01440 [Candidatus Woesearchaeota archaeon CG1_02_57_44]PIN68460.1 MAG: hypothetical protein COV94_04530 [Candidatus Woesearchaeota archaeon CG11_big_fil_rev_8_21_14_0_20_57_5]PIZ53670.1 MAG: hypothetical protein COY28_03400 [Candidatus Woesearchaeota archaeon CG_4_10_14_0_2_um_filter_57_5]